MTDFTRNVNIRQEVHFNLDDAVAFTILAASAFNIEAEPSLFIPPQLGFVGFRKQTANVIKNTGIRCRITPRCTPNRTLVNVDELFDIFIAEDLIIWSGFFGIVV